MARPMPTPQLSDGSLDGLTVCGTAPTPAATQALLRKADLSVLEAVFAPYACPGHMVDANLSGQTARQFGVALAPGTTYGRMHITRCGSLDNSTAGQTASTVGGTTAGVPATITVSSPFYSSEAYLGTGNPLRPSQVVSTGTAQVAAPSPARAVQLLPDDVSTVQMVEVNLAAGFCLEVIARTSDIETL